MLKKIGILLTLLLIVTSKVPKGIVNAPPPKQQGSHYFSQTEKTKEFSLNDLDTSKALVLILKPKSDIKDIDFELQNKLKFEVLYNGKSKKTCNMNTLNGLCVLPKLEGKTGNTLKVTCSSLPCEYNFDAIQLPEPQLATQLKDDSLKYLYKINANESLVKVKSNDPNAMDLPSKIRVYVNAPYQLVNKQNNLLYYDFYDFVDYILIYPNQQIQKSIRVKVQLFPDDVGYDTLYRFTVNKTKQIKIQKIPSKELRVDMTLSEVNDQPLKKTNISFIGYKTSSDSNPIEIQTFEIDEMQVQGLLDLNLILKNNAFTSLSHFSMKINSPQVLLVSFQLVDSNVHELEVQEQSYISLDKDQTVQYKIVGSSDSDNSQKVNVQILDQAKKDKVKISLNPDPCIYQKGCTMKVTAKEAVIIGLGITFDKQSKSDLQYIPLKNSVQLLLAEGQTMHLIHNQTSVKSKKITVNSGNVLVYIAGQKCPKPSPKCYEYSGSLQKPILIQNPTYPMYITVVGLEVVRFAIRVDETDSVINLQDGVAITESIAGNQGRYFRFKIDKKQDVNFNMIAPLNAFKMYIGNSNQKPDIEDINLQMSTNYVKFEKNQIDELVFTILVKKVDNSSQDTFTLIASTSNAYIVLGKGEPHYDVISEDQTKHYVILIFEKDIEDDIDTHVSFSIFQAVDNPNFTYSVGVDSKNMKNQTKIGRRHDLIDVEAYADEHCEFNQTDVCQLFLDITNHNPQRLDITLTLLSNNSVIQLKPGVWQSFQMASLTASSHFYFIPTNKKFPINLQFTHTFGSFKISYLLWKNQNQVHDAGLWPFPTQTSSVDAKSAFQTSDYVIHVDEIAKCFPNCILLISLVDTDKPVQSKDQNVVAPIFSRFGSYSIMASNAMIQLRETQKMSITLAKNESKYVTIDLTPYLKNDTNVISIHSTSMIGFVSIIGKLSSNRNPEYPTDNDNDYRVMGPELQIKMDDIKEKLEKNGMDEHEEVELIFMMKALLHSRNIISFTSKQNYIERLSINVPQDVHMPSTTVKYFSVEYYQDFKIKIVRVSGFPSFALVTCPVKDFDKCIDDFEGNPGSIINSKIDQVSVKYQDASVTVLKFIAKDDSTQFEVTAVGGNSATQLKQGQTINDFVQKKQTNRYKISVVKQTETIVTITVFEGNPSVVVKNDFQGIKMNGKKKGNLIQLHIPSSAFKKALTNSTSNATSTVSSPLLSNTALSSIFSELIVEVTDTDFNCSYSISFTIGERNLFIQDGTLTSGTLRSNESIMYSYHNSKNSTAFVSISFQNSAGLENCDIEYASFSDDQDEQPVLKAPAKLQVKSRAPKPSITFQLQEKYIDFEIRLHNKDTKEIPFNITINHVDIVMLPYGYKYPTYLGKNQSSYFVIEVFNEGYIQFDLKKCTQNPLSFSYALDDESFEDETYTFTSEVEDNRFSSFVHVKSSSIFLRVQAQEPALFSIQANWYKDKKSIPNNKIKAGDAGILQYVITGQKTATITFAPLNCEDCHSKNVQYQYILGKSKHDVLVQTACEGNFFLFAPIQTIKPQTVKSKPSKVQSGKLTFDVKLPDQLAYLGLKAKLSDGRQVFYSVIEISTIWGSIQKNKNYHLGLMTFALFMFVFCCYMYRKRPVRNNRSKRGAPYDNLPQDPQQFDP